MYGEFVSKCCKVYFLANWFVDELFRTVELLGNLNVVLDIVCRIGSSDM
jgi:hypothetical protein